MPLTPDQQAAFTAALNRLLSFYDGDHAYNPATYPGAFRQGGSVVNFYPALKDVATVMQCASVLVADATAAAAASPKAVRVDSAQSFSAAEQKQARDNIGAPYIVAQNISGSTGYRKWSDGFIEQWGRTANVSSTNVSFPITFPNGCRSVVGNVEYFDGSNAYTLEVDQPQQSFFGAHVRQITPNGTGINSPALIIDWEAKGY